MLQKNFPFLYLPQFSSGVLINKLRVTSYYPYELRLSCTRDELLFTSELRVTVYCTSDDFFLYASCELLLIAQVTSYFLTMSEDKDKDDNPVRIIML